MSSSASRPIAGALAAMVALVAAGTGAWWYSHRPLPQHLTLFYADAQGMILVPFERTEDFVRVDAAGPWAHALFDALERSPNEKLVPAVTSRMTLVDASWKEPTWTLTVQLPDDSGTTQETLLAGALVRSFVASYPGAQKVRLRLLGSGGKPYAAQHLDLGDPLSPADFANQANISAPPGGVSATLWWSAKGSNELVPVQLPLTGGTGSPPHDAFDKLVGGPPTESAKFLQPVTPKGLQASWVGLQADVARVDIKSDVPMGADGERFVKATVLTLTEFPAVKAVKFTHKDAPTTAKVGPFDLSQPIQRPANVNGGAKPSRGG